VKLLNVCGDGDRIKLRCVNKLHANRRDQKRQKDSHASRGGHILSCGMWVRSSRLAGVEAALHLTNLSVEAGSLIAPTHQMIKLRLL
jgi:hypothetical protein